MGKDMAAGEVEAYLAKLSKDKRDTLKTLRRYIRDAAPDATEGMSYGMPAFFKAKAIAGYRANGSFCSYYPMSGSVIEALEDDLMGYETSKGAIRLPVGEPPPARLIRKLIEARIAEVS